MNKTRQTYQQVRTLVFKYNQFNKAEWFRTGEDSQLDFTPQNKTLKICLCEHFYSNSFKQSTNNFVVLPRRKIFPPGERDHGSAQTSTKLWCRCLCEDDTRLRLFKWPPVIKKKQCCIIIIYRNGIFYVEQMMFSILKLVITPNKMGVRIHIKNQCLVHRK